MFSSPGRIHIAIDRTNWKFGAQDINFLTITALCRGVGVPLLFELLDKKGNSNTAERKLLLEKLTCVLPAKQIASFTADREFVGGQWYNYLVTNKIPFYRSSTKKEVKKSYIWCKSKKESNFDEKRKKRTHMYPA